jgi:hypothetical protein
MTGDLFPFAAPKHEVEVMFRGSKTGSEPFVLFPTLWNGGGPAHCVSWSPACGHAFSHLAWSVENSRPATPDEAVRLRDALRALGYSLKEVRRTTEQMDKLRLARMPQGRQGASTGLASKVARR